MGRGGSGMTRRRRRRINVASATDIWSYGHKPANTPFANSVNSAMKTIDDDFPGFAEGVNTVDAVVISGYGKNSILGFWNPGDKQLAMNERFTNVETMNDVMDNAAASGFHPSRGNRTGAEAVALHEGGHALTDYLAERNGYADLHSFSADVVKAAHRNSGGKGRVASFAGKISGYASSNYAETVAEAVADFYCNGSKAAAESKAIMAELRKYR